MPTNTTLFFIVAMHPTMATGRDLKTCWHCSYTLRG